MLWKEAAASGSFKDTCPAQKRGCCKAALTINACTYLLAKLGSTPCLSFLAGGMVLKALLVAGGIHCCCFSGVFVEVGCVLNWARYLPTGLTERNAGEELSSFYRVVFSFLFFLFQAAL